MVAIVPHIEENHIDHDKKFLERVILLKAKNNIYFKKINFHTMLNRNM